MEMYPETISRNISHKSRRRAVSRIGILLPAQEWLPGDSESASTLAMIL
jgi:hypothetical protein